MNIRHLFILFTLLGSWGCEKDPPVWEIKNLNGDKISVFGHGGMGEPYKYPMDSFESLKRCIEFETDGTEMDVCVSKDSVLVLCHSQDLESETKCSGLIKNKRWEELKDCEYRAAFTRADLIEASYFFDRIETDKGLVFTFDCKVSLEDSPEYLQLFATALIRHIDKYKIASTCFIESFNVEFLKLLQAKNKNLHLFLYTQNYKTGLAVSRIMPLYGLTLNADNISAEEIKLAHKENLRVTLFNTSTERENLDAIQKSPDFMQTDRVEYLLNVLKK